MDLVLINHAEREHHPSPERDRQIDRFQPLSPEGERQAHDRAKQFEAAAIKPTLYLSSRYLHATQTAKIICTDLGGDTGLDIAEIDALTPFHNTESLAQVIEQAKLAGHDPRHHQVVAIVGHYPRINQLFAQLTWRLVAKQRLDYGDAVRLTAGCFDHFCEGRGEGKWPGTDQTD